MESKQLYENICSEIKNNIDLMLTLSNNKIYDNDQKIIEEFYLNIEKLVYTKNISYLNKIDLLSNKTENIYFKILIYSFLMSFTKNKDYIENIIDLLGNSKITPFKKFFYYFQIIHTGFVNTNLINNNYRLKLNKIFANIVENTKNDLNLNENHINKEYRNKNLIFIITNQILTLNHAPTKTVLDRAYVLSKEFNKDILIINTADILSHSEPAPFFSSIKANKISYYAKSGKIHYKDFDFKLYQDNTEMPNNEIILKIIDMVKTQKPYFILNIGGNNITSDLCSLYIPTVSCATVFSALPVSIGTFLLTGDTKSKISSENIISETFTFDFKPQQNIYKRTDFAIPESKFIILIVGGRLADEVTPEFLSDIEPAITDNIHLVFAGKFENYDKLCLQFTFLKTNSTFIGFQNDMLAIAELCDIYINPPRSGGGSSAAECLYKGKPVITLNYGDCSVCSGNDFCVNNIEEMNKLIEKYCNDNPFYSEMSEKAKKRASILMDTRTPLNNLISKIEKSKLWW